MKNAPTNGYDVRYELFGLRLSNIELWKRVSQLKDRSELAIMTLNDIADVIDAVRLEGEDTLKAIRRIVGEYKRLRRAVQHPSGRGVGLRVSGPVRQIVQRGCD